MKVLVGVIGAQTSFCITPILNYPMIRQSQFANLIKAIEWRFQTQQIARFDKIKKNNKDEFQEKTGSTNKIHLIVFKENLVANHIKKYVKDVGDFKEIERRIPFGSKPRSCMVMLK